MTRSGVESMYAPATPVIAFVAPGPVVTKATPMFWVYWEYASAAITAACSWRQHIGVSDDFPIESMRCIHPPPGRRNTWSVPVDAIKSIT